MFEWLITTNNEIVTQYIRAFIDSIGVSEFWFGVWVLWTVIVVVFITVMFKLSPPEKHDFSPDVVWGGFVLYLIFGGMFGGIVVLLTNIPMFILGLAIMALFLFYISNATSMIVNIMTDPVDSSTDNE